VNPTDNHFQVMATLELLGGSAPADTLVAVVKKGVRDAAGQALWPPDSGGLVISQIVSAGLISPSRGGNYSMTPLGAEWFRLEDERRHRAQRRMMPWWMRTPALVGVAALLVALGGVLWVTM